MARILVADDSETIRHFIVRTLRGVGHEAIPALDGRQALDRARERRPDLIVMDCQMPLMSGPEAAASMAEDLQLLHVPLLFVSSLRDRVQLAEVLSLPNIAGYLLKPVTAEALLERCEQLLARSGRSLGNPAWDHAAHRQQVLSEWDRSEDSH